ncbi:MAG: M20 family metallopeptidase [Flammeovirgaceae bacterium]
MKNILFSWIIVLGIFFFSNAQIPEKQLTNLKNYIDKDYTYLEALYYYLHQNPELSFHEKQTSIRMAEELRKLGFEVTENFGGYGVVGIFKNGKGKTILVRTDTDALPVLEQTNLPYASTVKTKDDNGTEVPVMHACGHDVHMASWIGTARALIEMKNQWKGTLMFIAQPAEEKSGGAKAMLAQGLFQKFGKPDYALALHANASLPAGQIGYSAGNALANVDMVDITVFGVGGHGAYPHTTIDPIVLAARMILDLQTIISREINPLEPCVLTVGSIHGGTKGNIIPSEVKMELTLRSYSDEVREAMLQKIKRIIDGLAISAGLPNDKMPKMVIRDEYTPFVFNDPQLSVRVSNFLMNVIGKNNVKSLKPVMGGEDFGRFGRTEEKVPIMIYWLGTVNPKTFEESLQQNKGLPSLHSPFFAPLPEPTLKTGVLTMSSAVLDLLINP